MSPHLRKSARCLRFYLKCWCDMWLRSHHGPSQLLFSPTVSVPYGEVAGPTTQGHETIPLWKLELSNWNLWVFGNLVKSKKEVFVSHLCVPSWYIKYVTYIFSTHFIYICVCVCVGLCKHTHTHTHIQTHTPYPETEEYISPQLTYGVTLIALIISHFSHRRNPKWTRASSQTRHQYCQLA